MDGWVPPATVRSLKRLGRKAAKRQVNKEGVRRGGGAMPLLVYLA